MKKNCTLFLVVVLCVTLLIGIASAEDGFASALNPRRDYLIVVNDNSPFDWTSDYYFYLQQDCVVVADVYDGDPIYVEKAAYLAFTMLQHDLYQQGMVVGLYDAYRSFKTQEAVAAYYGNLEGWSETNKTFQPGYSEHHTGLLLNVMIWYSEDGEHYEWYTESAERQETIPYFKLLHERLADYGFIDRFPKGKEEWTGAPSEPYEIRFVGSSEVAHEIMDNGLCLEEYLSLNK